MRTFTLDKKWIILAHLSFVLFTGLLLVGIALPFILNGDEETFRNAIGAAMITTVLFGCLCIANGLLIKRLPFMSIAVDEDGIWYLHQEKAKGLIPWDKIYSIKERQYNQRLDLLDAHHHVLIMIEYQLNNFETLRDIVHERATAIHTDSNHEQFRKSFLYHLCMMASLSICTAISFSFVIGGNTIVNCLLMIGLSLGIAYDYFFSATGVCITEQGIIITYPMTRRAVRFADISNVKIHDEFYEGQRKTHVLITVKSAKSPFILKGMDANSSIIYAALKKAIQQAE